MKKILITGASGLIGSNVIKKIIKDHNVYAICRKDLHLNNIEIIPVDLSLKLDLKKLPNDIDTIIHLAQSNHHKSFPEKAMNIYNINVNSTLQLLEFARKTQVKQFIYASSGGLYGFGKTIFSESDALVTSGLGYYLSSKLAAELMLENYSNFFSVIILRFFFVYGPNQKQNMLMPRLINSISNDDEITIDENGGIQINPIYVEDASDAVIASMNLNGSHKINIAGNEIVSIQDIGEILGKILQKKPLYKYQESQMKNLVANNTKMKKLLLDPKNSIYSKLKLMLEFSQKKGCYGYKK